MPPAANDEVNRRIDVEIVMPVYRPDPKEVPGIVAAARAQRGVTSRLTMILDGPFEPLEAQLSSLISGDPHARLIVRPAARSDIATRGGILEVESAGILVLIDDDVEAPPHLAEQHVEALAGGFDVIMGRLHNTIPPRRDAFRPSALAYDRWYQHDRLLWKANADSPYWNFWAGNTSMTRSTLAAINAHMPEVNQTYNFDSFYGLIAKELGLRVKYRDDIVARHVVRKSAATVLNIGYRSGRSAALFARAGIDPERTDRDSVSLARLARLPFSRGLLRRYQVSHERVGARMVAAATWTNSVGLDRFTRAILEFGQMLERARGFEEFDHPGEIPEGITRALNGARRAGRLRARSNDARLRHSQDPS